MPNLLSSIVRERTKLDGRYRENASWQSMDAYINDWIAAQGRLEAQIVELRVLQLERRREVECGEWPRPITATPQTGHEIDDNGSEAPS